MATAKKAKATIQAEELAVISVAVGQLIPWDENVRGAYTEAGISELAAMIQATGLIAPPIVRPAAGKKGKFEVIDGGRRLAAIQMLLSQKAIAKDKQIQCLLAPEGANGTELGLAANAYEVMHPVDQYEAFAKLVTDGYDEARIAARFGVTETVVRKRLKLANVSPYLRDQARQGKMTLETLAAFTLSDDHGKQEQVWNGLQSYQRQPGTVKRLLTDEKVSTEDKRVTFIGGVEAYEQAGGTVTCDLFESESYLDNPALLNQLVSAKLQLEAVAPIEEGWSWVEIHPEFSEYEGLKPFGRLQGKRVPVAPLSEADQNKLAELEGELETLETALAGMDDDDEDSAEIEARQQQLQEEIDALKPNRSYTVVFTPEEKAVSGVILTIDYRGKLEAFPGLVRKEDAKKATALVKESGAASTMTKQPEEEKGEYSQALLETLTATKTAIVAAELATKPEKALAVHVFSLLLSMFATHFGVYGEPGIHLSASQTNLDAAEGERATVFVRKNLGEQWLAWLPKDANKLWEWCIAADSFDLLNLLAAMTAASLDGIVKAGARPDQRANTLLDRVGTLVEANPRLWYTPTAENFYSKVSKPTILKAMAEAGRPADDETKKLKKGELAEVAQLKIDGSDWLPGPLNINTSAAFRSFRSSDDLPGEGDNEDEEFDGEDEGDDEGDWQSAEGIGIQDLVSVGD